MIQQGPFIHYSGILPVIQTSGELNYDAVKVDTGYYIDHQNTWNMTIPSEHGIFADTDCLGMLSTTAKDSVCQFGWVPWLQNMKSYQLKREGFEEEIRDGTGYVAWCGYMKKFGAFHSPLQNYLMNTTEDIAENLWLCLLFMEPWWTLPGFLKELFNEYKTLENGEYRMAVTRSEGETAKEMEELKTSYKAFCDNAHRYRQALYIGLVDDQIEKDSRKTIPLWALQKDGVTHDPAKATLIKEQVKIQTSRWEE